MGAGPTVTAPSSPAEVAERLATGPPVRIVGGGTRAGWGAPVEAELLSTRSLDRIVDHSEGDFTAIVEAGVTLEAAQARFAEAGQMLALDPPPSQGATLGGMIAAGDSGPRRHAYGTPRDLVIGLTVALPDGTVAQAGGNVIKNVAGYDLSKLMAGAFGTLGVICRLSLRLHPRPETTATARFTADEPDRLGRIAADLAHRSLELDALDVAYSSGSGTVLARFAGSTAVERAGIARDALAEGSTSERGEVVEDDESVWEAQRAGQRSSDGTIVRISALPTELSAVLRAADAVGASVVGRAGAGLSYLSLPADALDAVEQLRRDLAPATCVVLDAPAELRAALDPWGVPEGGELALARRVKERFDPQRVCNPGLFLGGI